MSRHSYVGIRSIKEKLSGEKTWAKDDVQSMFKLLLLPLVLKTILMS